MENIVSYFTNAWRSIAAAILAAVATISAWIFPPNKPLEPGIEITAAIEEIDLSLPESKQYIDWYNAMVADRMDNPYGWRPSDKNPELCDITWVEVPDGYNTKLRNLRRDWDNTTEIVTEYTNVTERSADLKFYLRNKTTGKIDMISEINYTDFMFPVSWFYVQSILDSRYLLYTWYAWDGWSYSIYDRRTKRSTYAVSEPVELSDTQCLDLGYNGSNYYIEQVDLRKLAAGKNDAKRTVVQFDSGYSAYVAHVSYDKRFVHVNLYRGADYTNYRGIYDVETGAQVGFFEVPWSPINYRELISDDLEYIYWTDYQGELTCFWVIRYERQG